MLGGGGRIDLTGGFSHHFCEKTLLGVGMAGGRRSIASGPGTTANNASQFRENGRTFLLGQCSMQSFGKCFKKEKHFKKPLDRTWTVKLLDKHLTKQSAEWGGVITKDTLIQNYDDIIDRY